MAIELLCAKGIKEELGIHWTSKFFIQHLDLKAKFFGGLDRQRALAADPEIISIWFDLYKETVAKNKVGQCDIYNIDKKRHFNRLDLLYESDSFYFRSSERCY